MRSLILLLALCSPVAAQTAGEVTPPWTPGTLDIHQINIGKGNAAFLIFPDGTTMVLDAGAAGRTDARGAPPRPDGSKTPGEWIARYIAHFHPAGASGALDYGYLTHFHDDHMGAIYPTSRTSKSGRYKLTGITEVGETIPIRKMLDRGWPDYNFPQAAVDDGSLKNYRAFLAEQVEKNRMKVERLQPGRNDQIVLVRDKARYPNFEVRNIAANGEVWTGVGTNTRQHFPPLEGLAAEDRPTENMCSMAIRISYGKFDYFSGGDMPGDPPEGSPQWHDIETPVAKVVGPVEVALLNHHGNKDSMNAFFVGALRPQVFIIPVWSSDHPGNRVLNRLYSTRIYPGPRDVFATNMIEANKIVIGPLLDRLKSSRGHILVRVSPGGDAFRVIIIDDAAETYRVTAVHGPYQSR